ncbi:hypothetical protein BGZ72_002591 [Mortierella alpina]|nr:hypothetical protein BGZ72_002591 [Mortierella alpina]
MECVPLALATIIYEVEIVHFLFFSGKIRPKSPRDSLEPVAFLPWSVPETPRSWQGVCATWICGVVWFFSEFTLDLALILVSSDEDLQNMKADRLKRDKSRSKKRPSGNYGQVPYEDSQPALHERAQHSGPRDQVQPDAQQQSVGDSCWKPADVNAAAKDETVGAQDLEAANAKAQHDRCTSRDPTPQATIVSCPVAQPPKEDADIILIPHIDYPQNVSELAIPGSKAEVGSSTIVVDGPSCDIAADTTETTFESEATHTLETRARSPRGRAKTRKTAELRPRLMVPLLKAVQLVQSPQGAAEQYHGYYPSGEQKSLSPTTGESSETSSNSGEHSETSGTDKAKRRNKKKNKSKKRSKSNSSTTYSPDACSKSNESCSVSTSAASHSFDGQTFSEQEMVAAMENGDVELAFAALVSTLAHPKAKKPCSVAEDSN